MQVTLLVCGLYSELTLAVLTTVQYLLTLIIDYIGYQKVKAKYHADIILWHCVQVIRTCLNSKLNY